MTVDKNYCMSSYLTLRYVADKNKIFKEGLPHVDFEPVLEKDQISCNSAQKISTQIQKFLSKKNLSNAAILLSGGIDSAILASFMPKGTKAYTAICDTPGAIDETERAKKYCELYDLQHIVVDITWDDYLDSLDMLMINDGCPVSSNEPQVYKLAQEIKKDGCNIIIIGDNADMAFGGYDELLSKDWTYEQWKERYTYIEPTRVLKNPVSIDAVFKQYKIGKNQIDYIKFMNHEFAISSSGAYFNAFRNADIEYFDPYAYMKMSEPFDLKRIRNGESKYYLRELFKQRYPTLDIPEKIAMPRAVDEWMADWKGPKRDEFLPNCIEGLTGKQKFQIFALERFLNLIDKM